MTQRMSHGLVGNSIQELCVDTCGTVCVKKRHYTNVKPTLLLIAHCALPRVRYFNVSVLFLSHVVTVT